MEANDWKNDWSSFVESVCRAWDSGLTDVQATERHAHQKVIWEGVVCNVFRDGDVGLHMPRITFQLSDGRRGYASGLVLAIAPQDVLEWMQVRVGDRIRFATEIEMQIDNPFASAGIEWSGSPAIDGTISQTEGYISVSTRNSLLIEILKT